jgi:hypothetical protein
MGDTKSSVQMTEKSLALPNKIWQEETADGIPARLL